LIVLPVNLDYSSSWTSAGAGLTLAGNFSFPMDVDEGDF
jgi:hypothetical protein